MDDSPESKYIFPTAKMPIHRLLCMFENFLWTGVEQ